MKSNIETMNHQNSTSPMAGDIFDERYYSINKRLLSFIGQWPYESDRQKKTKYFLVLFVSCSCLCPQMLSLVVTWGKLDTFVACFTPIWTNVGCVLVLTNFRCSIQNMRKILDETRNNWESMRDLPQIKILQEHGEKGRLFTIMYSLVVYSGIFGWTMTPLMPKLLDIVAPLNHSRKRLDMFPTEYMVDPDKFFWLIFIHLSIVIVVVLSILVAVDSFYMSLAQHACGMFDILRYDLENLLQKDAASSEIFLRPDSDKDIYYHHIVSCIKRHKVLMKYVNSIQSSCGWILLVIIWMSVVALTLAGYQTIAKSTPKEDVVRMGLFTLAQAYHLYCITLPGHWITEASSFLPDSIYSCKWYMMSLRSRKLILLFIRASIEPCVINAGKIWVMSVENFCRVLKTSVSYLTMLTSMQ